MINFIITGKKHEGKTTYSYNLNNMLLRANISTGGFLSRGSFKDNIRHKFYLESLLDNNKTLLAEYGKTGDFIYGGFGFYENAFNSAYHIYNNSISLKKDIIFIDEVGKWELSMGGFYNLLNKLPLYSHVLLVCRTDFANDINNLFFNNSAYILSIEESIENNFNTIINTLKGNMKVI